MIHDAREYINKLKYEAHRELATKEGYQWIDIDFENNIIKPIIGSKLYHKANLVEPLIKSISPNKTIIDIGCDKGYFSWLAYKSGAFYVFANEIHPNVHKFTKTLFKHMKCNRIEPLNRNLFTEKRTIIVDYVFAFAVIHQIEGFGMESVIERIRSFCSKGALIEFCGDYRVRLGESWNLSNFESIVSKNFCSSSCVVSYEAINGDNPNNRGTRYIYDCRCN